MDIGTENTLAYFYQIVLQISIVLDSTVKVTPLLKLKAHCTKLVARVGSLSGN